MVTVLPEQAHASLSMPESRLKVHPGVFYRSYEASVVLYHTGKREVMTFSPGADEILAAFGDYSTISDAVAAVQALYPGSDAAEIRAGVEEFTAEALRLGVLEVEYKQRRRREDLEREISREASAGQDLHSATIELTYRCNERCRHCYVVEDAKRELTTDEVKDVLDQLAELNVCNVTFTGGEVFLRKDAFEILQHAYDRRFVVDIFTNGALLRAEDWIRLKSLWPRCVHFSVYSHVASRHDAITMVPGSFERTMASLRGCSLIGIPVNVKSSVMTETVDDVEGLIRLAESVGASIELGRNIVPRRDGDLRGTELKVRDAAGYHRASDIIDALISSGHDMPAPAMSRDTPICGAGEHSLCVAPSGEVFPCNTLPFLIGDVRTHSLREIWDASPELERWRTMNRRQGRHGCEGCDLSSQCHYCPGEAMTRTGDPISRYEDACAATRLALSRVEGGR